MFNLFFYSSSDTFSVIDLHMYITNLQYRKQRRDEKDMLEAV